LPLVGRAHGDSFSALENPKTKPACQEGQTH
jgi:hypothetical protein